MKDGRQIRIMIKTQTISLTRKHRVYTTDTENDKMKRTRKEIKLCTQINSRMTIILFYQREYKTETTKPVTDNSEEEKRKKTYHTN